MLMNHDEDVMMVVQMDDSVQQSSLLLLEAKKMLELSFNSNQIRQTHVMKITNENFLLNRSNVLLQKVKPLLFQTNLIHMNISCWNIFISTIQSWILDEKFKLNQITTKSILILHNFVH